MSSVNSQPSPRFSYKFSDASEILFTHQQVFVFNSNCKKLYIISYPPYHIPSHIISALFLCKWRDEHTSFAGKVISRAITAVALVSFALIGVIDAIARIVLGTFTKLFSSTHSNNFFYLAWKGLLESHYYLTGLQQDNLTEKIIFNEKITLGWL